jgi:hypothetical protein
MRIKWTALLPDVHIIGWSAATIKEQNGVFVVVKFFFRICTRFLELPGHRKISAQHPIGVSVRHAD